MAFTENLNYCMSTRKCSAYRLAKSVGVSNQAALNWQSGESIPHTKTRAKIADYFGITLQELDGEELPKISENNTKKSPYSGDESKIYYNFEIAAAELRKAIEKINKGTATAIVKEEKIEITCPIDGTKQVIYQPYALIDGEKYAQPNNGCDNCSGCKECKICMAKTMLKVMTSESH